MHVKIAVIVGMAALSLALPCQAQTPGPQGACRGVYALGEKVPPACQSARRGGAPDYSRWGDGYGSAQPTPYSDDVRPPVTRPHHFMGGYNTFYGFGR